MTAHSARAAVVAGSAVALALALAGVAPASIRTPLALWFLLTCPGLALAPRIGLGDRAAEVSLVVSLSVAVDIVVGLAMMYAGAWSPVAIFAVLAGISLVAAAAQLRRAEERRR